MPLPTLNPQQQLDAINQYNTKGDGWQRDREWRGQRDSNAYATESLRNALCGRGGTLWATNGSANEPDIRFIVRTPVARGFSDYGFIVSRETYNRELAAYRRELAQAMDRGTSSGSGGRSDSLPRPPASPGAGVTPTR
jgi:hypothetical protein